MSLDEQDLFTAISHIKDAIATNHNEVCQRLTKMETALIPVSEQLQDHEERLRSGEEFRWKATGILGLIVFGWETVAHYLFKK